MNYYKLNRDTNLIITHIIYTLQMLKTPFGIHSQKFVPHNIDFEASTKKWPTKIAGGVSYNWLVNPSSFVAKGLQVWFLPPLRDLFKGVAKTDKLPLMVRRRDNLHSNGESIRLCESSGDADGRD